MRVSSMSSVGTHRRWAVCLTILRPSQSSQGPARKMEWVVQGSVSRGPGTPLALTPSHAPQQPQFLQAPAGGLASR